MKVVARRPVHVGLDPTMVFRPVATGEPRLRTGVFAGLPDAEVASLYAAQQAGSSTLLVGWLGDRPLGMASLEWMGPRRAEVRALYPDCVEVHSLRVEAAMRSEGIGSRLLAVCEGMAIGRGFACTGMAVAVDNVHAYALCLRRGYADRRRVEFDVPSSDVEGSMDAAGTTIAPRRMRFLIKSL